VLAKPTVRFLRVDTRACSAPGGALSSSTVQRVCALTQPDVANMVRTGSLTRRNAAIASSFCWVRTPATMRSTGSLMNPVSFRYSRMASTSP
jgi:hypothetical protein